MKLLFDENLSPKLARLLEDIIPNSTHVRNVGLNSRMIRLCGSTQKEHVLILVSKDADMHQRSFLFGPPPKVVWVRLGNCSTSDVEKLIRKSLVAIKEFNEDERASFLSLSY